MGPVGWWRVRSRVEPRPFRAAARPAARPLLSVLSNFSLSMGAGRGSLGSPEMIETTITLSLPWEAWGREASVLGVTVAGLPFLGRGALGGAAGFLARFGLTLEALGAALGGGAALAFLAFGWSSVSALPVQILSEN